MGGRGKRREEREIEREAGGCRKEGGRGRQWKRAREGGREKEG